MSDYWKTQNLEGNGLQTINQQYSRLKLSVKSAYLLCLLFPLGAHQFYLRSPVRGLIFILLSGLVVVSFSFFSTRITMAILFVEIAIVIVDLKKMDNIIVRFNKQLKMNLSLQTNTAPPLNFKGRYTDDNPMSDYLKIKENEVTAFETKKNTAGKSKIFSFSEQEAMLKELSKKKPKER